MIASIPENGVLTALPSGPAPLDVNFGIGNFLGVSISAFALSVSGGVVEIGPVSWDQSHVWFQFAAIPSSLYSVAWIAQSGDASIPPELQPCDWTQTVDIRVLRADGQAFTVGTISSPFSTRDEDVLIPEAQFDNHFRYLYLHAADGKPIPPGLSVTLQGASLIEGSITDAFMVDIGTAQGNEHVYTAPVAIDWWDVAEAVGRVRITYQAPDGPPASCPSQSEIEQVDAAYEQLSQRLMAEALPSISGGGITGGSGEDVQYPELVEVEPPVAYSGGTAVTPPATVEGCACDPLYRHIAQVIDVRLSEIVAEIRGARIEFVNALGSLASVVKAGSTVVGQSLEEIEAATIRNTGDIEKILGEMKSVRLALFVTPLTGSAKPISAADLLSQLLTGYYPAK